jgi:diguanylate cyclase (GGDEF)-like protein
MTNLYRDVESTYIRETEGTFIDSLTGLYNHGFFLEILLRELRRAQRSATPFSLAVIDFNGFGLYNDRYGAVQADKALREAATIIHDCIRASDVAARFVGDAFIVLLTDTDTPDAEPVLRRIKSGLDTHFGERLSVCIGCVSSRHAADRSDLLRRAVAAVAAGNARGADGVYVAGTGERPAEESHSRVLIVDDQEINLKILGTMLKSAGYEAISAENGAEALSVLDREGSISCSSMR